MSTQLRTMGRRGAWSGALLACCLSATATAQEKAPDFKALYAAAAYDEALSVLAPLDTVEAYQYKALCLLALGRQEDVKAAVASLVTASPSFVPSLEEAPPRLVELVASTRKTLLPVIARRAFAEGRDRFAARQHDEAARQFALVLTLVSDPAFEDTTTAQDLKTLAQGFIDLARATAAPPPVAQAVPTPSEPVEPPPQAPVSPPTITQPVALEQPVPAVPSDVVGRMGPTLTIMVEIDSEGRISAATVRQSAHPLYDRMVVQSTREWRYTPATLNGRPIPSEQLVTIQTARPSGP